MGKITTFLREAKSELMKVNWPNKKQITSYTVLVISISIAGAIFLGSLDFLFSYLLKTFIIK
ncbi:MAG: Preprotein translocase, SecE subunit [uncultured bacterium]|nr:MAG: Preprotein translocase, SecE subunit [uncultured bacterium]HCU70678.1 preprotein translocase subunit SecE [Candidatus Moranbacteria bacterium]